MKRSDNLSDGMSRRGFGGLLGLGAAAAVFPATPLSANRRHGGIFPTAAPVIGFHADAPYVDPTGRAVPYLPPPATGRFVPDNESLARIGAFL